MDSLALYFSSDEDEEAREQILQLIKERRVLRQQTNVYDLPDAEFVHNFRLTKDAFKYVLDELEPKLKRRVRSSAIPAAIKLATTLRVLAEGGYQLGAGNDFKLGLAQPTVSKCLTEVVTALQSVLCPKWIQFQMSDQDKREAMQYFYAKTNFSGAIGCVDGTHIAILSPRTDPHLFYNRKGFYSLNAMVICDHKMRIRFFDARYPGASHDALIWNTSQAKMILESNHQNGEKNSWLLGDAGYPLEPWLITPFRAVESNSPQSKFNAVHAKTRNIVKRTIGLLKNRFRCLLRARQLHYSPEKATTIANVCAALHNVCIQYGSPNQVADIPDSDLLSGTESNIEEIDAVPESAIARRIRNQIMNSFS